MLSRGHQALARTLLRVSGAGDSFPETDLCCRRILDQPCTVHYAALHCGKPGRRTCMFSYEPFTAILEVPEVSPEVVWLLWVVGEALGTTSAPLKAQKPAKTS